MQINNEKNKGGLKAYRSRGPAKVGERSTSTSLLRNYRAKRNIKNKMAKAARRIK